MKRDNASSVKSMRKKSRIHRKEKRKTIKEGLSSITHPAQESYQLSVTLCWASRAKTQHFYSIFKQTIRFILAVISLTKFTISFKRNFKRCNEMITPIRCRWRQQKQGIMDRLPTKQVRTSQPVRKFTNLTKMRTNWLLLTCDNEMSS